MKVKRPLRVTVRKLALVLAGALALTIAASGGASAAAPTVNEHTRSTETFPEEICGVPGTSTLSVVENFKLFADGTFLDTISSREVFTAQNGKSVVISVDRQASGPAEPIQNADGTITFITTYKGATGKALDQPRADAVAERGHRHARRHVPPVAQRGSSVRVGDHLRGARTAPGPGQRVRAVLRRAHPGADVARAKKAEEDEDQAQFLIITSHLLAAIGMLPLRVVPAAGPVG
jgi:hypothetical protein